MEYHLVDLSLILHIYHLQFKPNDHIPVWHCHLYVSTFLSAGSLLMFVFCFVWCGWRENLNCYIWSNAWNWFYRELWKWQMWQYNSIFPASADTFCWWTNDNILPLLQMCTHMEGLKKARNSLRGVGCNDWLSIWTAEVLILYEGLSLNLQCYKA